MHKKAFSSLVFILFVFLLGVSAQQAFAQSATNSATSSATATSSAATQSATATTSSTTKTATPAATTLPATGAHDVLILSGIGLIFVIAGITAFSGTKEIFADFE